jgi:hypothetical protein
MKCWTFIRLEEMRAKLHFPNFSPRTKEQINTAQWSKSNFTLFDTVKKADVW